MSGAVGRLCPCLNPGSGPRRAAKCAGGARRTGRPNACRSRPDGTNRDRPGLREALAACRSGDTLVVTKLDRLARSLPDARDILEDLTIREVKLSIGGSVHDPTEPVGRLLFNVLAMVAEFEFDLIRLRTKEGMRVAQGEGASAWPATEAQPAPGGASGHAAPRGRAQHRRTQRPVRSGTLNGLSRHRARRPAPNAPELST